MLWVRACITNCKYAVGTGSARTEASFNEYGYCEICSGPRSNKVHITKGFPEGEECLLIWAEWSSRWSFQSYNSNVPSSQRGGVIPISVEPKTTRRQRKYETTPDEFNIVDEICADRGGSKWQAVFWGGRRTIHIKAGPKIGPILNDSFRNITSKFKTCKNLNFLIPDAVASFSLCFWWFSLLCN